ncbi:hypothetical protein [Xanthocytophaga flava]|uniref:hypothetical protein n=1 Tax=Xanthocytophaga flava TaxID=3048013 RepID=UPI0028D3973F|nr:hypothetical protein [Xanthocytophaga flavus]MDJ1468183.1 hypothetical protein [Xanthocytophaga flavus]
MKITLESTDKIVHLNNVPARIWEGETNSGIKVHCYITRIAVEEEEPRKEEFDQELQKHKAPSEEVKAIPFRMIL